MSQLSQHFEFSILMQNIELSRSNSIDILSYKLIIYQKSGVSKQLVHSFQLTSLNTQQIQNYYRIDILHKIHISQKLIEKEKGAGYGDQNFKLLFYIQNLKQMQFMGLCTLNLAYYPNANIQQLYEKKFLTSTNDKKAALFFEMCVNDDHQNALTIEASDGSLDSFQTPVSTMSNRQQSSDKQQITRVKASLSQHVSIENSSSVLKKSDKSSKIIKIGQRVKTSTVLKDDDQITLRKPSIHVNGVRSPSIDRRKRPETFSTDKRQVTSKTQEKIQKSISPVHHQDSIFIKPRANSPQPLPMPNLVNYQNDQKNDKLSKKFNILVDKFNSKEPKQDQELDHIQEGLNKQEEEIQNQLSQIDKRIENHKLDNSSTVSHSQNKQYTQHLTAVPLDAKNEKTQQNNSYHQINQQLQQNLQLVQQSPQNQQYQHQNQNTPQNSNSHENDLQKTLTFLREENDRLRERAIQEQPTLNVTIKELNWKLVQKDKQIEQLRQSNEDITNEFIDLQNKVTEEEIEKLDLQKLIQKLRFELDSQNMQIQKGQKIINQSVCQVCLAKNAKDKVPSEAQTPVFQKNNSDQNTEVLNLQNSVTALQTRNSLLQQQNEQLKKIIDEMNLNSDDQLLYQVTEMESKLQDVSIELNKVATNRNELLECMLKCNTIELKISQNQIDSLHEEKDHALHDSQYYAQQMEDLGRELVRTKQQLAEAINAAFEMGGADLVDLIGNKLNNYK